MVRKVRLAIYELRSFYRLDFSDSRKWQPLEHALAHILIPPTFTHRPPSDAQASIPCSTKAYQCVLFLMLEILELPSA